MKSLVLTSLCLLMTSRLISCAGDEGSAPKSQLNTTGQSAGAPPEGGGGGGYLEARQQCMVYCEQTLDDCMQACTRNKNLCRRACVKGVTDCKTQCHIQFRGLAPPIDPDKLDEHIDHEHENGHDDRIYLDEKFGKDKLKKRRPADHLARYRSEL